MSDNDTPPTDAEVSAAEADADQEELERQDEAGEDAQAPDAND